MVRISALLFLSNSLTLVAIDAFDTGRSVLDVHEANSDSEEGDEDDLEGEEGDLDSDMDEDDGLESGLEEEDEHLSGSGKMQSQKMDISSDDDSDEHADQGESDDEIGGWGANKRAYYNTNNLDDVESDSEMDEEDKRQMEIREVRKLQAKSRQGMTDDDFGLGSNDFLRESGRTSREQRKRDLDEDAADVASTSNQKPAVQLSPEQLMAKVQKDTPETIALAGEYADVVEDLQRVTEQIQKLMEENPDHPTMGLVHLHHQTLMTYVTLLAFYFHQRAARQSNGVNGVSTDAVVERLAKLKAGLSALEGFGLGVESEEEEEGEEGEVEEEEEEEVEDTPSFLFRPPSALQRDSDDEDSASLGSLEEDELDSLVAEEKENRHVHKSKKAKSKALEEAPLAKERHTKKNAAKESLAAKSKASKGSKKALKRQNAPLAGIADLVNQEDHEELSTKKRRRINPQDIEHSDVYGEPTALTTSDSADKEAKRRSLKFHTGQIDARDARQAKALQGDVDIPYRDRERSRVAVANANANRAAKMNGAPMLSTELDGGDWGEDDSRDWQDVMDASGEARASANVGKDNDDTEYYDLIAHGRKAERRARKEQYDEQRASERIAPDDVLEDGQPRAINRTIEKNKGLSQRKPKANRNPRVKKRLRYEKAQKKLSSRGPVYKGGQSSLQGGYGGEKSGISSHVVKSRRFA